MPSTATAGPARPGTVLEALAREHRRSPGRPLLTLDDDTRGERVDLSVTTVDNWVTKLANLFADELELEPGARIAVELPTCWQGPVAVLGGWAAGLVVVPAGGAADVRVVGPDASPETVTTASEVLACSLRPLGLPFSSPLPPGWRDFSLDVPSQPDILLATTPPQPGAEALDDGRRTWTHAELVDAGYAAATVGGLAAGGRLATDLHPLTDPGLATALLAPLVTGSSVVLLAPAGSDRRERVADQERATATAWTELAHG